MVLASKTNKGEIFIMRKLFILIMLVGILALGSTAIAKEYPGKMVTMSEQTAAKMDREPHRWDYHRPHFQCSDITETIWSNSELLSNECSAKGTTIECTFQYKLPRNHYEKTVKWVQTNSYWLKQKIHGDWIAECPTLRFPLIIQKDLDKTKFQVGYDTIKRRDSSGWSQETVPGRPDKNRMITQKGWVYGNSIGNDIWEAKVHATMRKEKTFPKAKGQSIISSASSRLDKRFFTPVGSIVIGNYKQFHSDKWKGMNNGNDRISFHVFRKDLVMKMLAPHIKTVSFSIFDFDSYEELTVNMPYKISHPEIRNDKDLRTKIGKLLKTKDGYTAGVASEVLSELKGKYKGAGFSLVVLKGSTLKARFVRTGYYYLKFNSKINSNINKEVLMDSAGSKTRKDKGNRGTIE